MVNGKLPGMSGLLENQRNRTRRLLIRTITLASSGFLNPSRSGQHVQERTFRTRFIHGKHQSPATGTGHRVLSTGKHLGNTSGRRDTNH